MLQKIVVVSLLSLFSWSINAASLENKIQQCAQQSDSLQRLLCFDNIAQSLQVKPVVQDQSSTKERTAAAMVEQTIAIAEKVPVAQTVAASTSNSNAKELVVKETVADFGREQIKQKSNEPDRKLSDVTLTISKVKKDAYKKLKVNFDNGQIWQQTDATKLKLAVGDKVVISRSMFNSFLLKKLGTSRIIRVKRIK